MDEHVAETGKPFELGPDTTVSWMKRGFRVLGIALLAVGRQRGSGRSLAHVHANYASIVTWGLWVTTYIYFIGLSVGAFLVSSPVYAANDRRAPA